ncbi:hypothetical protein SDC9_144393 [bioreactor metagenome]|uniref:Uncharacterized protein n=1 Tax=bioreactor metagenome TaxID=1076179 RepID=A0A645E609_9ZZZZ
MFAPDPVRVEEFPGHTEAGDAETETTGLEFTVTVTVVDPVQPNAFVPVTV